MASVVFRDRRLYQVGHCDGLCVSLSSPFYPSSRLFTVAYGTNFVALAIITFCLNETYAARNVIVMCAVVVWGLRLAFYLFSRVRAMGKDARFDGTRDNIPKFALFWLGQIVTVWIVSIPFSLLSSRDVIIPLGWQDGLGIGLWVVGFVLETVADFQKFRFKNNPETAKQMYMGGVWRASRHPNYFGELLQWWGIWSITTSVNDSTTPLLYISVLSPLFLTALILFASGIPTLEVPWNKKYGGDPDFRMYRERVPPLITFIPACYEGCPDTTKCLFCCEFPMYAKGLPESAHSNSDNRMNDQ